METVKPCGLWRRTSTGKWIVAIEASVLASFDGRAVVRVKTRAGRYEDVTIYKIGEAFVDPKTKKLTVYGHASMRTKAVA